MHRFILSALVALAACQPTGMTLDEAREVWLERGSDDYTWVVSKNCFCENMGRSIEVTVEGGEVVYAQTVSVTDTQPNYTLEPSEYEAWMTVEGLFDELEEALDTADEVHYTFAWEGFPERIEVDEMLDAIDDEYSFDAGSMQLAGLQ